MTEVSALFGQPMMLLPDALIALANGADMKPLRRLAGGELPFTMTADGTAVISILGPLSNRGWFGSSYAGVQAQLAAARGNAAVKSVLLDIESPGGQAAGAPETAAAVRSLAAAKPVVALVNGMAASAAYLIASGAGRIVTTPSGLSGSIGVAILHADFSRALDKAGITPTIIFAGARKADGRPYAPLSDRARTDLQREVDQLYGLMVESVAAGRKHLSATAIRATEARVFLGADAVKAGLADEVGTFESALAAAVASRRARLPATPRTKAEVAAPPPIAAATRRLNFAEAVAEEFNAAERAKRAG